MADANLDVVQKALQEVTCRVAEIFVLRAGKIAAHWEIADTGPLVQLAAAGLR